MVLKLVNLWHARFSKQNSLPSHLNDVTCAHEDIVVVAIGFVSLFKIEDLANLCFDVQDVNYCLLWLFPASLVTSVGKSGVQVNLFENYVMIVNLYRIIYFFDQRLRGFLIDRTPV